MLDAEYRLRHRRRRFRRRCAGRAAERGPDHRACCCSRPGATSAPPRRRSTSASPTRCGRSATTDYRWPQLMARRTERQAAAAAVARPGDGRQLDHQRPDRHPRRARRFRPLGGGGLHRAGAGPDMLPYFRKLETDMNFRRRALPRQPRPDPGLPRAAPRTGAAWTARCAMPRSASATAGATTTTRPRAPASRPTPSTASPAAASRPTTATSSRRAAAPTCTIVGDALVEAVHARRQPAACHRRARARRRPGAYAARRARGDPVRRRHPLARHPAALRHRPGRRCCTGLGIPVGRRPAGGREPARPSDHGRAAAPAAARAGRHR